MAIILCHSCNEKSGLDNPENVEKCPNCRITFDNSDSKDAYNTYEILEL